MTQDSLGKVVNKNHFIKYFRIRASILSLFSKVTKLGIKALFVAVIKVTFLPKKGSNPGSFIEDSNVKITRILG